MTQARKVSVMRERSKKQQTNYHCPHCKAVAGYQYHAGDGPVRGIFLIVRFAPPPVTVAVAGNLVTVTLQTVETENRIEASHAHLSCASCGRMFNWWASNSKQNGGLHG